MYPARGAATPSALLQGDEDAFLLELIGCPELATCWLFCGLGNHGLLDGLFDPVLDVRLGTANLLQSGCAALLIELLKAVEGIPSVSHHLTCLGHIAQSGPGLAILICF